MGAAVTLLRANLWEVKHPDAALEPWTAPAFVSATGAPIDVLGCAVVQLAITEAIFPTRIVVIEQLTADAIFGLDFLAERGCMIQVKEWLP